MKRRHILIYLLVLVFSCLLSSCGSRSSSTQTGQTSCDPQKNSNCHSLVVTQSDGSTVTRTYVLHLPANFQPGSSGLVLSRRPGRNWMHPLTSMALRLLIRIRYRLRTSATILPGTLILTSQRGPATRPRMILPFCGYLLLRNKPILRSIPRWFM